MHYTTQQISEHVRGRLVGPGDLKIGGVEQLSLAQPGQISFVRDQRHVHVWEQSRASAALIGDKVTVAADPGRALVFVDDADLAVAEVLTLFAPPLPAAPAGVHPQSTVDASASLGQNVSIGPGCYIGPRATIGDGTILYANVVVLDEASVGAGGVLWPGVIIGQRCRIGDGCILHGNVTVGADGFGYRPSPDGSRLMKIPQIGTVQIGHDVEIGAGTCIDRAKFSATTIGDGTKIDNLCQIAHNCRIGRCCIIAGMASLAGSVTLEDAVVLGGRVAVRDNVRIGRGARIAGTSSVAGDVPAGATWGGSPAQEVSDALREYAAVRKLPEFMKSLRQKPSARQSRDTDRAKDDG
jgi:UDP-3-O-[3-hydroxymyristoyl] glucosamine N-acyltransferase